MTDATQTNHLNGFMSHYDKGFYDSMIASTPQLYGYELVLEHMKSGKTITPQQARELYGIENLSSAIRTLRTRKWRIVTETQRDENGASYPTYFLMPGAVQPDNHEVRAPLFDATPTKPDPTQELSESVPEPAPALPLASVPKESLPISILNVRLGPQGPEIQMVPAGEPESDHPFCRPSPSQIRYLSLNLKLFTDLDDEKRR